MTRRHHAAVVTGRPLAPQVSRALPGALLVRTQQVFPDPDQPRHDWGSPAAREALEALAQSVATEGILQPLVVREESPEEGVGEVSDPRYRIIAGARRHAAAVRAGLVTVPVLVQDADPVRVRILQLTENLLRHDLAPLDEARAYADLLQLDTSLSPETLAKRLQVSATSVRNALRLLDDTTLARAVESGQLTPTAATIIAQAPPQEREVFLERVRAGETLLTTGVLKARMARVARASAPPADEPPPEPAADTPRGEPPHPASTGPLQSEGQAVSLLVTHPSCEKEHEAVGPAPLPHATYERAVSSVSAPRADAREERAAWLAGLLGRWLRSLSPGERKEAMAGLLEVADDARASAWLHSAVETLRARL